MPTPAASSSPARRPQRDAAPTAPAAPADPWGLSQLGLWGGQAARFWVDGWLQGQQTGQSLLQAQWACWQGLQSAMAQVAGQAWTPPGGESLHVMPDSAGPALCPPEDFTPASLARSALGGWLAWMAAWSTALRHELQDLEDSRAASA